ncbi:MAG: DUF1062 domain-containing protein [Defluviitaleaceae bacterium]|nr:DUF1062 domain-containing protein [Defluviitaleaceae bacterium]
MRYKEVTLQIIPKCTPLIMRHCSKCNRKMGFYCSEKFRVNANQTKIDIWLIYKCQKCDTTCNLTVKRGIKPHDLSADMFDKFTNNDTELAWEYAFDKHFLRQNNCVVSYENIEYSVDDDGMLPDGDSPLLIHIKSLYKFDLKLSAFLAGVLGVSNTQIKKYVDEGLITAECNIMKYKIRADISVFLSVKGTHLSTTMQ